MRANAIERLPELATARHRIMTDLRETADIAASDFPAALIVVTELLSNALRYGGGAASYAVEWDGSAAVLHVWDNGPPFRLAFERPPVTADGGRGLAIVRELASDLSVTRAFDGNYVRCVLPITRTLVD